MSEKVLNKFYFYAATLLTYSKVGCFGGPMVIMLVVTLVALTLTIVSKTQLVVGGTSANVAGDCLQLVFAVALFVPGVTVAFQGIRKMFQKEVA